MNDTTVTPSTLPRGIDKSAQGLSTLLSMIRDLSSNTVPDIASFNPMLNSNHLGRYTAGRHSHIVPPQFNVEATVRTLSLPGLRYAHYYLRMASPGCKKTLY